MRQMSRKRIRPWRKAATATSFAALKAATREEKVSVEFIGGRTVEGAILFNESKGCGKVINVEEEVSVDFRIEQIAAVKL